MVGPGYRLVADTLTDGRIERKPGRANFSYHPHNETLLITKKIRNK